MNEWKPDGSFDSPGGWFIAKNTASDAIPPFGVCALDFDANEGMALVSTPGDNEITVAFNGKAAINPGERGYVHCTFPCAAAVEKSATSSTTIQRGAALGTASGRFTLQPGKTGFRAVSDDIDGVGVVNVVQDVTAGEEAADEDQPLGVDSASLNAGGGRWFRFPISYTDLISAGGATTYCELDLIEITTPFVLGRWGLLCLEVFCAGESAPFTPDPPEIFVNSPYSYEFGGGGNLSHYWTSYIYDEVTGVTYPDPYRAAIQINYQGTDWRTPSDPVAPNNFLRIGFDAAVSGTFNDLTQGRGIIYLWITAPFTVYPV